MKIVTRCKRYGVLIVLCVLFTLPAAGQLTQESTPAGVTIIGLKRTWGAARKQQIDDPMPAPMRQAFEKVGLSPIRSLEWENVTPDALRQSRVVIVLVYPHRLMLTDQDRAVIKLLQDYAAAGGGVLFGADRQQQLKDFMIPLALAEAFGTELLVEDVHTKPELTFKIGEFDADKYTFTDAVLPPVNQGVRGVFFHAQSLPYFRGVVPFVAKDPWQVVLHSGENASTSPTQPVGLEIIDSRIRDAGFDRNVPLTGIRSYGKGRVSYFAMNMPNIFVRAADTPQVMEVYTAYMRDGYNNYPSDMLRFITNLLAWLGGNANSIADAKLTIDKLNTSKQFDSGWKLHRGVIGPRTTYSSGSGTPDEYVAKAKELGLDFIVFLEDFAQMKIADFEKLRNDCARLTTSNFIAVPGITWKNTDGNHQYAYSSQLLMPSRALLDPTGKHILGGDSKFRELHWLYTLNSFENQAGWYLFKENPYPYYDARVVGSMGVITQKGDKVIERVLDQWAYTNLHDQALWPHALNLASSPGDLNGVSTGKVYVNVVGANGFEQLHKVLTTITARSPGHLYPGSVPFGFTSVSAGPIIELDLPRGDTDTENGQIYCRALQSWPIKLSVTSNEGLKEVRVMDGQTMIRRYLPGNKDTFKTEMSISKDHQSYIWVHAIDTKGRDAFTRAVPSNAWLMRDQQCSDRNNQLFSSLQNREDGSPYTMGYTATNVIPDKGPWNPKIRPVGAYIFDPKMGLGSMSYDGGPEGEPLAWMAPEVWWDGNKPEGKGWIKHLVAGKEGGPHIRPNRIISSADVLIADQILDGVFPMEEKEVMHVWYTLLPFKPSKVLATSSRRTFYLPKIDGITAYLYEQDIEVLQDIPVGKDANWAIKLGWFGGDRVKQMARKLNDNPVYTGADGGTFTFNKKDYVGFYGDPFGSLAVYNIGEKLLISGDSAKHYNVFIPSDRKVVKKGTRFSVKLLIVGMHRLTENPIALTQVIQDQYGLGVPATGYQVNLTAGHVASREYTLGLNAGPEGNVQGVITGLKDLAGNLGSHIIGLNNKWSACLYRGGEPPNVRFIPVTTGGTGYAVLQSDLDGKSLFIGHPYVADNSNVVLSLARTSDGKSWQIEVHNPTDQTIKTTVRQVKGWHGPGLNKLFVLAPGTSEIELIGVALP